MIYDLYMEQVGCGLLDPTGSATLIIRIYFSSPRQLNLMTTNIMQATSTPTRKVYSLSSEVSAKITQFFLHILYM